MFSRRLLPSGTVPVLLRIGGQGLSDAQHNRRSSRPCWLRRWPPTMDGGAAARNRTAHGVLLALLLLLLLAHGVAAPAPSPCTGTSLALPAAECNAWVEFFDSTQGLMGGWSECTENRLDPCACSYDTLPDAGVGCTRSGHIAQMYARARLARPPPSPLSPRLTLTL